MFINNKQFDLYAERIDELLERLEKYKATLSNEDKKIIFNYSNVRSIIIKLLRLSESDTNIIIKKNK